MIADKNNRDARNLRQEIREGSFRGATAGLCPGMTQANVVIVPASYAFHFLLYCQRNPKPCPVLEVLEEGCHQPKFLAQGADIRTDCPRYRIFRPDGVEERYDIVDLWQPDWVTFLLGCSFTFESALLEHGIPVRHVELERNVPMFITNRATEPAGPFRGPLVVTMRPVPASLVSLAARVTAGYPGVHGAPIHVGHPELLGIEDLQRPDFGDPVPVRTGEVPVFWACGVTPQEALLRAELPVAVTHAPGHMFVSDRQDRFFAHL